MTEPEIRAFIRELSVRLEALQAETPEMSGPDFAFERGWITQEEWEATGEKSRLGAARQEKECARLDALRKEFPDAVRATVQGLLDALSTREAALRAQDASHFDLSLIPSLEESFSDWLEEGTPRHWMAWAWRVGPAKAWGGR